MAFLMTCDHLPDKVLEAWYNTYRKACRIMDQLNVCGAGGGMGGLGALFQTPKGLKGPRGDPFLIMIGGVTCS